jgi:hypothetical protein
MMFARLQKLFATPKEYWSDVVAEPGGIKQLLFPPGIVGLLIGAMAAAQFLGSLISYIRFGALAAVGAVIALVLTLALQVGVWIAFGYIINGLAGSFNAQQDIGQAMKLATGALTPVWLGGLLHLTTVSALGVVGTLGGLGYGAYILYLGLPIMNGTPQEKTVGYTIAAIAILFVVSMIAALLVGCPVGCLIAARIGAAAGRW